MSQAVRSWTQAPHLSAAAFALASMAMLLGIVFGPLHIERRLAHFSAPEMLDVKDEGLALQDEAFHDKDLLPIYGSSEFRNDSVFSGREFFSHYPTGFELFIVGKAGAKTLITAERLGALGDQIHGKKVVIILSPTWFLAKKEGISFYEGNFSALQAEKLIFNGSLSPSLKRDLSREMLKYPRTLVGHPLLAFELKRLAQRQHSFEDRLIMRLGHSESQFLELLDHMQTTFTFSEEMIASPSKLSNPAKPAKTNPDWDKLIQRATAASTPEVWESEKDAAAQKLKQKLRGKNEVPFPSMLKQTDEWDHLVLLLRTLHELGAKPLFLSIPINAISFETAGVTSKELQLYYDRLRHTVGEFHYPLATFEKEQRDPFFFGDSLGHPSCKGWMIFNHTINEFYHGKLPATLD